MPTKHLRLIDVFFLGISVVAVPVAVFHVMSGRPAQALIAVGAAVAGIAITLVRVNHPEPIHPVAPATRPAARPIPRPVAEPIGPPVPTEGWLQNGLLAGMVATAAMTVALLAAFVIAEGLGDPTGGVVARWFWNLTHNPATEAARVAPALALAAQLALGLAFAVLYSGVVAPRLRGPGWRRGLVFSLPLWLLSVVVFLPIAGGGLLGLAIGAGPLPLIGNLAVHLVYGATLGAVYAIPVASGMVHTSADLTANARANRGAAIGMVAGGIAGGLAGLLIEIVFTIPAIVAPGSLVLAGGAMGGAWGAVLGSLAGLSPEESRSEASLPTAAGQQGMTPRA
jgi:hypothetical protein